MENIIDWRKYLACQALAHEKLILFEEICDLEMEILAIRADLGMEVMHERNAHNFPLDLA